MATKTRGLLVAAVEPAVAFARTASAQTFEERLEAVGQKVEEQGIAITSILPFEVGALISTRYSYSFNTPKDPVSFGRIACGEAADWDGIGGLPTKRGHTRSVR